MGATIKARVARSRRLGAAPTRGPGVSASSGCGRMERVQEGDWFGVPLPEGGYGLGVAARLTTRGGALLGYFFGPRRSQVPTVADAVGLRAQDAVLIEVTGSLGLRDGEWPVLGRLAGWDRTEWPMPVFIRREPDLEVNGVRHPGRVFRVYHDEDDPELWLRDVRVPAGAEAVGPSSLTAGYRASESRLSAILRLADPPAVRFVPAHPVGEPDPAPPSGGLAVEVARPRTL